MEHATNQTVNIQRCLDRLREGDPDARAELLSLARDRLYRLAHNLLRDFPAVRRWEETDDVFQQAAMRLERALAAEFPSSVSHFFRLAAMQIRRELIDLSRHYYGPEGMGRHHHTDRQLRGDGIRYVQLVTPRLLQTGRPRWRSGPSSIKRLNDFRPRNARCSICIFTGGCR
jgi:hypothetical protein